MAFMDMKATALLVGEKGFDLETTPVIFASLVRIGEIGYQIDGFFVAAAPPTNQVQGNRCIFGKADLAAQKHLTFCQGKTPNWLAVLAFTYVNLRSCPQNKMPGSVFLHPNDHISGVILRIAQQNHFTFGRQERNYFLQGLNMPFCRRMAFLPLVSYPSKG